MKILLIRPGYSVLLHDAPVLLKNLFRYFSKFIFIRKPLSFPILAALSPEDCKFEVAEGGFHNINFGKDYDLVGITCNTPNSHLAYKIADEFRNRGIPVVLGGIHATILPNEAKKHADSVVIGEAEETWPELLTDLKNNKLKPFYEQNKPTDLSSIPYPKDIYPEHTGFGVQATRGCPHRCDFCVISHIKFGNIYRMRPIDAVINELKIYPEKYFTFQDNSLTVNLDYTKELFTKMKGLNIKFIAYGNINILGSDDELLKLASDAGCIGWLIGFESVCQESLNGIGKKFNQVDKYMQCVKKIHDYEMMIEGSFVFGFDHDTPDIFNKTDEFVRKSEIDLPFAMALVPYPGTKIYKKFEKENRLLTKDWSKYNDKNIVFKPKLMSPEELYNGVNNLNNKWHNYTNGFRRIIKHNKAGFFAITEKITIVMYYKILRKRI